MISRAGLVLNPGQVADLVLAWRQVAQLSASISRDRPLVDDFAIAFRLPSPQPKKRAAAKPPPKSRTKTSVKSSARAGAPKRPVSRKTAPKRR